MGSSGSFGSSLSRCFQSEISLDIFALLKDFEGLVHTFREPPMHQTHCLA